MLSSSQKNYFKAISGFFKNPSLVLICISFFLHCSIFKVHASPLTSRRQLINDTTAQSACQELFYLFLRSKFPQRYRRPLNGCLHNIAPKLPLCQHFFDAFLQKNFAAKSCGFLAAKSTKLRVAMGKITKRNELSFRCFRYTAAAPRRR